MAKAAEEELDHVDRFLASIRDELPQDLDITVEGIVDRIGGLNRRFKKMMEETLAEFDLSWGEWKVLGRLLHQGPPYRMSPGKLADYLELSSGAMTNRIDQLEEAGLIRRLPDPTDRRGVQVELTDKGRSTYRQPADTAAQKEALVASALNARDREQLNSMLRRLMIAFEKQYPQH